MVHYSLLFIRIPLSQLAYFQFPVISNKEKFVLALVINIIFPVIYFYDDNPLRLSHISGNTLPKDTTGTAQPILKWGANSIGDGWGGG